jgi:Ser/Thr protein kinase RdoA (MazF antagonist)
LEEDHAVNQQESETLDWQSLFKEPVRNVEHLSDGYANDSWMVQTAKRSYVVKITRTEPSPVRPFWDGLYTLFGLNVHTHIEHRRTLARFIRKHSQLKVPAVTHVDDSNSSFPHPFVIYNKLPGETAGFNPSSSPFDTGTLARDLGEHLGKIHRASFQFWGTYPSPPRFKLADWPGLLSQALQKLAPHWFMDQKEVMADLVNCIEQARALPAPDSASLVLPDLRGSQFLVENGHLSAIVDIESHVLGSRELDFIALEYLLAPQDIPAFIEGYTPYLSIPNLTSVRQVYRYLYWVIAALGETDYPKWMNQRALF